jgi:hypothetical protein
MVFLLIRSVKWKLETVTRSRRLEVRFPTSYSEGTGFESRPGGRLSRDFLWFPLIFSRKILEY